MSNERVGSRLSGAEFKRVMLAEAEKAAVMAEFGGHGLVRDVVGVVGDGKEATVYLCEADPATGAGTSAPASCSVHNVSHSQITHSWWAMRRPVSVLVRIARLERASSAVRSPA